MIKTIHQHHLGWNPQQEPAVRVAAGDSLELQLLDASGNRVQRDSTAAVIPSLLPENANPLSGPVHIEGAEPGDTLVVDILDFSHSNWGGTAVIPGFGLLTEDFPEAFLHLSDYDREQVRFTSEIALPTRPFAGTIGTCPDPQHSQPAIPPHACGGNIDFAALRRGARLYLPVKVPGALFSVGDGHAAQGDGEICGTAVETRLAVQLRFGLLKQQGLAAPWAELPAQPGRGGASLVTLGIGPDLLAACRDAVRYMLELLQREYQLEPVLGYCLLSCAGNLALTQVVNLPNYTVSCTLDRGLFH